MVNEKELQLIQSETLQVSRFEIVVDDLKIGDRDGVYSYVKIKPGICVIAKTENGFVLLKEYRYPIKQWSYEFAAGIIDEGETPEQAAIREVKEETGYSVLSIEALGEFYPSFGATDEVIHLFYAECGTKGESQLEDTELIDLSYASEEELDGLIASGEFKHGAGLAAWLKYKLR